VTSPNAAAAGESPSASEENARSTSIVGEFVEPVQLQVVCFSLFRNLPAGTKEITETQLTQFGDVDQALRDFYQDSLKEAAAKAKLEEDSLRHWFEKHLITEAGTRGLVFRGESTTGGIPNPAVDALEELHIIRAEVRGGDLWYELSHDRFIQPVLRVNDVWRARVQEAERKKEEEENRRALDEERAEAARSRQQAEEQHRQAQQLRHLVWALVAMLLMAIAAIAFAFWQRGVARAREFVAASILGQDADPELSVLLAAQAVVATWPHGHAVLPEAEQQLHNTILASHVRLTLSDHSGLVSSVAWSPDGKRLATASEDDTVQIYAMDIHDLMALARVTAHPSEEGCKKYLHVDKCPPFPSL